MKGVMSREGLSRPLSEIDAAYLAGIIDGEGSICWYKQKRGRDQPMILIVSTNYELMEWLAGISGSIKQKSTGGLGKIPCWHWRLGRTVAVVELLEAVAPHMKIKRQLAEAMLAELTSRMEERFA